LTNRAFRSFSQTTFVSCLFSRRYFFIPALKDQSIHECSTCNVLRRFYIEDDGHLWIWWCDPQRGLGVFLVVMTLYLISRGVARISRRDPLLANVPRGTWTDLCDLFSRCYAITEDSRVVQNRTYVAFAVSPFQGLLFADCWYPGLASLQPGLLYRALSGLSCILLIPALRFVSAPGYCSRPSEACRGCCSSPRFACFQPGLLGYPFGVYRECGSPTLCLFSAYLGRFRSVSAAQAWLRFRAWLRLQGWLCMLPVIQAVLVLSESPLRITRC
jgi:hypothetical protein